MTDIEKFLADRRALRAQDKKKWAEQIVKLQRRIDRLDDKEQERRLLNRIRILTRRVSEFEPVLLQAWLLRDTWTIEEGILILIDLDPLRTKPNALMSLPKLKSDLRPNTIVRLDTLDYGAPLVKLVMTKHAHAQALVSLKEKFDEINRYWAAGMFTGDRYSPVHFLSWALRKKIKVNWVEWALRKGWVSTESLSQMALPPGPSLPLTPPTINLGNRVGDARVIWRILIEDNIAGIDALHNGKAGVTQILRWVKQNGGERIVNDHSIDELHWVDDSGGRQVVTKKTISNAISSIRSSRRSPV